MVHVISVQDLDVSSFQYMRPRTNASGGQTIYINTPKTSSKRIVISVPKCTLPFGVSEYNGRKSLQFSLRGDMDKMVHFKKFLAELDLRNVQTAVNESATWFKKKISPDIVQTLYNPCMKQTDDRYPPMFRARFPTHPDTGRFMGDIFDVNKKLVNESCITPGCQVEAIVEMVGIYFVAKEFGVSWKVVQLKVYPSERLRGYSFLCDSDDDASDAEPN
jgi:hypothetical protein